MLSQAWLNGEVRLRWFEHVGEGEGCWVYWEKDAEGGCAREEDVMTEDMQEEIQCGSSRKPFVMWKNRRLADDKIYRNDKVIKS